MSQQQFLFLLEVNGKVMSEPIEGIEALSEAVEGAKQVRSTATVKYTQLITSQTVETANVSAPSYQKQDKAVTKPEVETKKETSKTSATTTKKASKAKIPKDHKIAQYSEDGKAFIASFKTAPEAEAATGANKSSIGKCLTGKRKLAGGFAWKRVNQTK